MTKEINLNAKIRAKEDKKLNRGNYIPAVLYGSGIVNQNLSIKKIDFEKVYSEAGDSSLINLSIEKNPPVKILVKELQKDPVKDNLIHIDLYQVDMNKKITTEISLEFIGESMAVKELGGILVRNKDSVLVECLPDKLVNHIDIDISKLKTFNDYIKLFDIKLPEGLKLKSETDDIVVNVTAPKIEKEEDKEEAKDEEEKEGEEISSDKDENVEGKSKDKKSDKETGKEEPGGNKKTSN